MCLCVCVCLRLDLSGILVQFHSYFYAENNQTMQMLILTLCISAMVDDDMRGVEYYQMYVGSDSVAD